MELYNKDCRMVISEMDDNSVDITFTSPPYNRKRNDKYLDYNDDITDYYGWLCDIIDDLLRVTKRHVFFNIQKTYYNKIEVFNLIGRYSKVMQEMFIWEKSNPMPASGSSITNAYEYVFVLGKDKLKSNMTYTKNHITTSVNTNMPKEHKAVMHPYVSDWFIERFAQKGDVVFDPFMGIGTTGKSSLKFDLDFIGCELSPLYFNMAHDNLNQPALV